MKTMLLLSALFLSAGFFPANAVRTGVSAQRGPGLSAGPDTAGCKDCLEVKNAIRAARTSSGTARRGKGHEIRNRALRVCGRMHMKMKKMFSHRKKSRTSYEICFGWQ